MVLRFINRSKRNIRWTKMQNWIQLFTISIGIFIGFDLFISNSARAHSASYAYEGLFAGSMICQNGITDGEIGVLFHIEDDGPISRGEFDRVNGTCRSGSGSCNITHDLKYAGTRKVKGSLYFFPIAANPTIKPRTYIIEGTGTRQETETQSKMAVLKPSFVTKYLDIQSVTTPEFPADLSGISFKITIENPYAKPPFDKMSSQVDGHQCHNLTLSQMKEF